jgi:predicted amidohydrolase YtcJ
VIDAHGAAVVPGFTDSHIHFLSGAQTLDEADLNGLTTVKDIQQKIRDFAAAHPDRPWIVGMGWLYSPFPGGFPTKDQLDAAVSDRPAIMRCYDGHSVWVNSKAIQLAGITKATPDPPNGIIVKDAKTGELTGLFKESASQLFSKVVPQPTRDQQLAALRSGVALAHRFGVTRIHDAGGTPAEIELFDESRRRGDLRLRVYHALLVRPGFTEHDAEQFEPLWKEHADDPVLKLGIIKMYVDGVVESRTAALLAPYANSPTAGSPNYSVDELNRTIAMLDRRGWQIQVHAIGDRGIRMVLDAFEAAMRVNPMPARGRRHRVEHIETIDPSDVPRFGKLGVIASMQPLHVALGDLNTSAPPKGPWPDNLGPERALHAWQWKSIKDGGARVIFGSDWSVASMDPLQGLWLATTRLTPPRMKDQKFTLPEAIDAYTREPAYASFDESRFGTLAPGMFADVVILSRDIFSKPSVQSGDVVVDTTIFDGKVAYTRSAGQN